MNGTYLRLSVTDRCNLRCFYCMPDEGIRPSPRDQILSFEDTLQLVRALDRETALTKIRLTGGEPLVRKGVVEFVGMLARAFPAAELCMTTNGLLLERHARDLAEAGLRRINVSLDTLVPQRFRELTRGGELGKVLAGIRAARAVGLAPIRINRVALEGLNDDEILPFVHFALDEEVEVRFLELMDIGEARGLSHQFFLSGESILRPIAEQYSVRELHPEGTAVPYEVSDGERTARIGLINPVSNPFCSRCNRLRLDTRGQLFSCLHSEHSVDLASCLRSTDPRDRLRRTIREAVCAKAPPRGANRISPMSSIGG